MISQNGVEDVASPTDKHFALLKNTCHSSDVSSTCIFYANNAAIELIELESEYKLEIWVAPSDRTTPKAEIDKWMALSNEIAEVVMKAVAELPRPHHRFVNTDRQLIELQQHCSA